MTDDSMPTKEGVLGGKEGNFGKGKGYEGMMGSKEGFEEGMKRGKRDFEGKRGKKMGGGSDWLLKRGIWEKQVSNNKKLDKMTTINL